MGGGMNARRMLRNHADVPDFMLPRTTHAALGFWPPLSCPQLFAGALQPYLTPVSGYMQTANALMAKSGIVSA